MRASDAAQQQTPPADEPRPFLKWAGGKRQLLPYLLEHVPRRFGTYFEPFLGGGALFFHRRPQRAVLSDRNERLIRCYRGVRGDVAGVVQLLRSYPHDKEFFLRMRKELIDSRTDSEVAAWLIYLNRTGYNGLYRVNSSNVFNVPFGEYANPNLCDEENLRSCSGSLLRAEIRCEDFEAAVRETKKGDFVYFDPPYVPLSVSSRFTSYTSHGFGMEEQRRLRDVALELKRGGVSLVVSNSSADAVRELYARGFDQFPVPARRSINSKANGRAAILELLIR